MMTPFFFGHGGRRLFGAYSPASGQAGGNRAIVLCHPWGQEYMRAHRSMRHLATLLSAAGLHVLRFDYSGTGDSSGELMDSHLDDWLDDIGTAMDELRDTVGAARVGLIGLRLGGALAWIAATRRPREVDQVVLWDPILSGRAYVDELLDSDLWTPHGVIKPLPRSDAPGGGHEVQGFELTAAFARQLQALELPPVQGDPLPRLLAISGGSTPLESIRRALAVEAGGGIAVEEVASQPAWLEDADTGAGAIPVKVMQRIVQWAAARHG